jgi:lysophospholipase L1-like esterase
MKWLRLALLALSSLAAQSQAQTQPKPQPCPQPSDWAGLNIYGSEDSELAPPSPAAPRVVLIGDEVIAGLNLTEKSFINRGVPGQTTQQMLLRFRQDVIDLHPKVVVIEGGLNDIAAMGTEGTITENLASMTDLARLHGIRVVIASVSPVCDCVTNETGRRSVGRIAGINRSLQEFARQTGAVYLNDYAALVDPVTRQMKRELTNDGFLPNANGYALMVPLARKAIAEALALK